MPKPSRAPVFLLAIRDAGFDCQEVIDSGQSGAERWIWRVRCAGALAYWGAIDDYGYLTVEPAIYWDNGPAVIPNIETLPLDQFQQREFRQPR